MPHELSMLPAQLRDFVGEHRGDLHILGANGDQVVPMGLTVSLLPERRDAVQFVLSYGNGEAVQRRDYLLVLDDAATGRCHIDEQNGIVLTARCCDGEIVCAFSVAGHTNVVRYRSTADGVAFALDSLQPTEGTTTGGGVMSHPHVVVQRAQLMRQT